MTKLTYVSAIETVISALVDTDLVETEVMDKMYALKESLEKRNSSKSASRGMTKTQKENVGLKVAIVEGLEHDTQYTITEIIKTVDALEGMTNQKVSALVRQLCISGEMVRSEDKGRAYFALV